MRAAGLHSFFRNRLGSGVQIELRPGRGAEFTRPYGGQHQQADGVPSEGMYFCRVSLGQQLGEFGEGDVRVVASGFWWRSYRAEVCRGIGVYGTLGQAITEYLV